MDQEGVETWEVSGDRALAAPAVPSNRRGHWSLAWEQEEAAMVQKTTEATWGQKDG